MFEAPSAMEPARFQAPARRSPNRSQPPVYLVFQTAEGYVPTWPSTDGRQRITMHPDFEVPTRSRGT